MPSFRLTFFAAALAAEFMSVSVVHALDAVAPAQFVQVVTPFLEEHCADCHDEAKAKGGFRVDTLALDFADPTSARRWEKVFDRVTSGEMPPKKSARPPQAGTAAVLGGIEAALKTEGARRTATEGRAQRRRLNRNEYENTLRDLLSADIRVAAELPEDGTSHGFSTVDEALTLSAVQMEKYLEAADRAFDTALGGERPPESTVQRFSFRITMSSAASA